MKDGVLKLRSSITPVCVIGVGGQSTVYLAFNSDTNQLMALKIAKTISQASVIEKESDIISMFKHGNIISLIHPASVEILDERFFPNKGFSEKPNCVLGVEISHLGSVYEYLMASQGGFPMPCVRYFAL
jgi:serine/threonine protein kinase